MAENVDPDMPPTLSAIFRRRESALQDDIQRATNTTLFRKSVVDTFYPPEKAPSESLPIVIQGIRKHGAPTPPPRVSSLEEPTIEDLPPPPADLLEENEDFPPPPNEEDLEDDQRFINESYFENYAPQTDRPVNESLVEDFTKNNSVYGQLQGQEETSNTGYGVPNSGVTTLPPAMARRKPGKTKKFAELQEEGKNAIDSPGSPTAPDLPPDDYILDEFEERSMIEPSSFDDPKLKQLINVLIEWINDELASQRIIVKDIEEDLFDGQILQKLLEKLSGVKLDVVEVTQSEELQKQKLQTVLDAVNKVLGLPRWNQNKWSVENIHSKNVVSIIHLLVALVRHFRAPIRLTENVSVNVVVVQKKDGRLQTRTIVEELTSTYDDLGMRVERDAFDTLFDHAPDKLQVVKQSLVTFVNKHLNRINLEVNDLDNQFHDGVYLTLLMGLLEGYFVPLYSFHLTPTSFDQKVANVALSFELMMEAGLGKPKARPEDLVNLDLKSTLRVLYNLFTKYKGIV